MVLQRLFFKEKLVLQRLFFFKEKQARKYTIFPDFNEKHNSLIIVFWLLHAWLVHSLLQDNE